MDRPRCSVYIAASVDGYIARPDGGLDWLAPMMVPGEDYGYHAFFATIDALVMGRKTYEVALGFPEWPYAGKRVVVLTHRPIDPRHGEERYDGPLGALAEDLGKAGVQRVYVDGGDVIRQFLDAGLVDDLTLSIIPVILGDGIPLFRAGRERWLQIEESRSFATGLVQNVYRVKAPTEPARAAETS